MLLPVYRSMLGDVVCIRITLFPYCFVVSLYVNEYVRHCLFFPDNLGPNI